MRYFNQVLPFPIHGSATVGRLEKAITSEASQCKGSYHGGSTVIGTNSGWFSNNGPRPKRKPLTMEQLVQSAQKSAKAAQRRQAEIDARMAEIQGLPSTIGQTHKAQKKKKRGNKPQARQR